MYIKFWNHYSILTMDSIPKKTDHIGSLPLGTFSVCLGPVWTRNSSHRLTTFRKPRRLNYNQLWILISALANLLLTSLFLYPYVRALSGIFHQRGYGPDFHPSYLAHLTQLSCSGVGTECFLSGIRVLDLFFIIFPLNTTRGNAA